MFLVIVPVLVASALAAPQHFQPQTHFLSEPLLEPKILPAPIAVSPVSFVSSPVHPSPFSVAPVIQILRKTLQNDDDGQYLLDTEDTAGTRTQEQGTFVPSNDGKDRVLIKIGRYSFVDPAGKSHSVSYKADQYGYQAVSADIPVQVQPIH